MNYYREIKEELINNEITKRVKDYSKNRSDLNTYYNVGKLLSEAGKHYGEGIIKEYSKRLTNELGKGYTFTSLTRMRNFYLMFKDEKIATVSQLLTWSHYSELLPINNICAINYYIKITEQQNLSVRQLRERIKNKEYERLDDKKIKIEMSGTKPTSGKIKITNGSVDQSSSSMTIGDYTVSYNSTKKTYEATEKSNALVLCKAVTELSTQTYISNLDGNSHTEKTGVLASDGDPYAYGVEYTCELGDGEQNIFYVLDSSNDTVSLIMSKNIGTDGKETTSEYVSWCTDADYDNGGDDSSCNGSGVKEYLSNSTKNWTKLTLDQITIPTEVQIKSQFIKGTNIFGNDSEMIKPWLNENLIHSKDGYWVYGIMSVSEYGVLENNKYCSYSCQVGVRPVITISKSQLG